MFIICLLNILIIFTENPAFYATQVTHVLAFKHVSSSRRERISSSQLQFFPLYNLVLLVYLSYFFYIEIFYFKVRRLLDLNLIKLNLAITFFILFPLIFKVTLFELQEKDDTFTRIC